MNNTGNQEINPITRLDYPDPDVIRVDNTYYMVSTTMHFMPGCEILRSYDLVNWEPRRRFGHLRNGDRGNGRQGGQKVLRRDRTQSS